MGRRRFFGARREVSPELRAAGESFAGTLQAVEVAKASLVTAVRAGRAPGAPLAEALAGFELRLAEAAGTMERWRSRDVEAAWVACHGGLREARRRAEAFRLSEPSPQIYEHLIAALEDLMDPLEPFEGAAHLFRAAGVEPGTRPTTSQA
jgi:hypothetical protein